MFINEAALLTLRLYRASGRKLVCGREGGVLFFGQKCYFKCKTTVTKISKPKKEPRSLYWAHVSPRLFIPSLPQKEHPVVFTLKNKKRVGVSQASRAPPQLWAGRRWRGTVVVAAECKEALVTPAMRSRRMFMEIRHFSLSLLRNEVL